MRRSAVRCLAPWVPPPRGDTFKTVPPLPAAEYGGPGGCSDSYSERIARTPHWKRMAMSTYKERMKENETSYPMSPERPGEFDIRYLPAPYPDMRTRLPLTELGSGITDDEIPRPQVPVIFLEDVYDDDTGFPIGLKNETVYLDRAFVRTELFHQRFCLYATPENYKLLGLPVVDHMIHKEIARNTEEHQAINAKRTWDEEPWKFSFEYLFRRYENGPPELQPGPEDEWDGEEPAEAVTGAGAAGAAKGAGFVQKRKAKKIKLF